nr:integrase, catalytic region, zinc finger, CCHC-type, peptidase aspartic, catalytic [Tanacetum cinerariifolium]
MSQDVITVGSTMRIPLLYQGEYSQWRERFMNYLEEQTDGEAMINPIQNDPKFWTAEEKKTRKIDRLFRMTFILSLIAMKLLKIYGMLLERQMRGSKYGEQDKKAAILYEYETLKAIEEEQLLDTYLRYLQVINDLKKCGYKKDNCDVNDALGYKKKVVVVTSDPLALVAEKTKVSKRKEKVIVSSNSEGSGADDFSELKKITALLAKAFNRRMFYSKPTNNNLRTSFTSQSANKKQEFVKSDDKKADDKKRDMSKVKCYNYKKEGHFAKDCKKENVKDYNYYKTKMLLAKKDSDEQVLLAKDQAWMESSSDSDQEINANMVFMAQIEKKHIEKADQQSKDLENQNKDLQEKYDVLLNQVKHVVIDTHTKYQAQYAKLEEERYKYMIRYSALCDNDKQHRKKIDEQEILFDKISRQLVEMNNNVLRLPEKILEKETKISELEGCVSNKDVEIEKCLERLNECENKLHKIRQTNQTIHMIKPSKDTLYNGRKGIGFENPNYLEKAKDLRPSLYDEKVIGLGYTSMFLIHSDEALEIKKFKRDRENKIKFAYDYGNLNASYVNEKINFSNDYFQEIINPDFEKIDSPFQQTSSLKPYVPNVILEKIIIDLEYEVMSLLEKEKTNLKTIESLKSKGFESSENAISDLENQSENDCHVVEKSVAKWRIQKKRRKRKSSKQNDKQVNNDVSRANSEFVHFLDLDTLSSVRIPKLSRVIWKNKVSSNTSNADLSFICLWIFDLGCSKHMTGNRALLKNFLEKFFGTVCFGNNEFAMIAGYGDVVIGSMTIKKVYYVEGLGHNLFSVGQFRDKGLEVAFRKSTCFVQNEDGVELLTGDHSSNLYTIALNEVASNSSTYILAKISSLQSWLWHQRLSYLNFTTINNLMKNNLVQERHNKMVSWKGGIEP